MASLLPLGEMPEQTDGEAGVKCQDYPPRSLKNEACVSILAAVLIRRFFRRSRDTGGRVAAAFSSPADSTLGCQSFFFLFPSFLHSLTPLPLL